MAKGGTRREQVPVAVSKQGRKAILVPDKAFQGESQQGLEGGDQKIHQVSGDTTPLEMLAGRRRLEIQVWSCNTRRSGALEGRAGAKRERLAESSDLARS